MDTTTPEHKNPSRRTCEEAIRRILMTEVLQNGQNNHFKNATDFMEYFEALYPAGPSLLKQVQRAIKAMDMPKDERGYFIINKSKSQLSQDHELTQMLRKTNASFQSLDELEKVFLACEPRYRAYLKQLIEESQSLRTKYVTLVDSSDGLIFYTENKSSLINLLRNLIEA